MSAVCSSQKVYHPPCETKTLYCGEGYNPLLMSKAQDIIDKRFSENIHIELVGETSKITLYFHAKPCIGYSSFSLTARCVILSDQAEDSLLVQGIIRTAKRVFSENEVIFCPSDYGPEGASQPILIGKSIEKERLAAAEAVVRDAKEQYKGNPRMLQFLEDMSRLGNNRS